MFASSNQSVATEMFAVVPSDTVNFTKRARRLFIGGAGNLSVVDGKGNTVAIAAYPASSYLDAEILRVNATGTTATGIVAFV
jgi:hypothetical protein